MKNPAAVALGRLGGKKGGPARMAALSAEARSALARRAARARWTEPPWKLTTPAKARQDEIDHWRRATVEERFLAVEVICAASYALYHNGDELPRLARVHRMLDAAAG
mgnify:FL=1